MDCWVWGGGGLRELMIEAEAAHPVDTSAKIERKIKPKGVQSTRRSDRQLGEDVVIENIDFGVTSRSLQALRKGGKGGQIRPCDVKEWNYFPSIEREKNNRNAFTSVNELKDNRVQVNENALDAKRNRSPKQFLLSLKVNHCKAKISSRGILTGMNLI